MSRRQGKPELDSHCHAIGGKKEKEEMQPHVKRWPGTRRKSRDSVSVYNIYRQEGGHDSRRGPPGWAMIEMIMPMNHTGDGGTVDYIPEGGRAM